MTFGPSTSNADLADAIEEIHNRLNGLDALQYAELEVLAEASVRLREIGDDD